MRKLILKIVLVWLVLLMAWQKCLAQKDTIFFDKDWKECKRNSASFFRLIIKRERDFLVTDYYMSGHPQMIAECSAIKPKLIREGKCTFYDDETGLNLQQGKYHINEIENYEYGLWMTVKNNGKDTIYEYKNITVGVQNNGEHLYIGIDNPVVIDVPELPIENLNVKINQGIISGKNGKYVVTSLTKEGKVLFIFYNNEKYIGQQELDCSAIPAPVAFIGVANGDCSPSREDIVKTGCLTVKTPGYNVDPKYKVASFNFSYCVFEKTISHSDIYYTMQSNSDCLTEQMKKIVLDKSRTKKVLIENVYALNSIGQKKKIAGIKMKFDLEDVKSELTNEQMKSKIQQYEKEKLEQTNKLNEAEIEREKAVLISKQNQIEMAKQDQKMNAMKDAEKEASHEAQLKQNTIVIYSVVAGLLIVLVFAGFVVRSLRVRNKQNKIITEQKEELHNSIKNLELLNNISSEITSSLNVEKVMSQIYKNVSSLMDVSFFIISTYNEIEQTVEVKYCVKEGEVVHEEFKTSIINPESYTAWTIKNRREVIIMDEETERINYLPPSRKLHGKEDMLTDSIIFIPLFIKNKVIGLFSVQSKKKNAYSKYHIEILRSLSSVIAVALNNADSFSKLDSANIEILKQKKTVEEKNREITDSISYALRIQTAILPPQKIVKQYLENSFILYKPKDIVAGDFYWMETVEFENLKINQFENEAQKNTAFSNSQIDKFSNCILFAACDCTGHGVPGAMVSVVCHNALNRAVREYGLTQPAQILDKTAEIVIENFSKSEENIKDGMDISLAAITFNKQNKTIELQWAGANNPLWIVRNSTAPLLEETKADKQPIGMNEDKKPFTNHTFTLNTGDSIYLFTDGFADQFGGETGEKKLTRKRFKELLLSIQHRPMNEQGITLDKFISDYRKEVEQIDDILVMGVRV